MEFRKATTQNRLRRFPRILIVILCIYLVVHILYSVFISINNPPQNFPIGTNITIPNGYTVREIANIFAEESVVRSSLYLYLTLIRNDADTAVRAGIYQFDRPLTTQEIAQAITEGLYMSPLSRVTFPEGFRASNIYVFLPESFKTTPYDAIRYEGYLFPDTYFISSTMDTEDIVTLLRNTFTEKIEPYLSRIAASGFTLHEVITFASIVEREAKDQESKKLVAGILHNRLNINMPLQVDAVFDYLLNKTSAELTMDDLALDSPYNTYRYRGLPPGPIANPSLDAIEAVLSPTKSDYLYYLTAPDGTFYYAVTFEEHVENKRLYLR